MSGQKRIWGWMAFDWAQQPYATLGLTFIFAPYFAAVAADYHLAAGLAEAEANARAQSLWTLAQTVSGLFIALSAPVLGAFADTSGRTKSLIGLFTAIGVACAFGIWGLTPDGAFLIGALVLFWVGYTSAECAFNLNNSLLPSMGKAEDIGRISGSATAFGYWGGVVALFIMLLLAENDAGTTLLGYPPPFGLDPDSREGTRIVGPVIGMWLAVFSIPFFVYVSEARQPRRPGAKVSTALVDLRQTLRGILRRPSLASFLAGSMLYRDGLTAVYALGGIYAALVLEWQTIQIGIFGIVAAIAAAIISWLGGRADARHGPLPVIRVSCLVLIGVCAIIVGMSRDSIFGIALSEGSIVPDAIFYVCGAAIGGAGGTLYASSRTIMTRHTDPSRPAEAFGLFALSGKATAFVAPLMVTIATRLTGSVQWGVAPVILLFLAGLILLRWVNSDGDRAEWSQPSETQP